MKRLMSICIALIFSGAVFAQEEMPNKPHRRAPDPKERQEQMLNQMKEKLELTPGQTEKIEAIMEQRLKETQNERETMRKEIKAFREEQRQKMEELQEKNTAYNDEIKAVLNEGQAIKYDQYLKEKREAMKNYRRRPEMKNPRRQHLP